MGDRIVMLGPPRIVFDAEDRDLSGRKTWGLLTYLLLEGRSPTRREVAAVLFDRAADPLAALRWSLLQVRRALQPRCSVIDDGGRLLVAHAGVDVDVLGLLGGRLTVEEISEGVGGELIEGIDFSDAPAFEDWLLLQRERVSAATVDALRWAATTSSGEDPDSALALLARATRLSPFNDALHEGVVRLYASRGDADSAHRYVERVTRNYLAELGQEPPDTLRRPLEPLDAVEFPLVTSEVSAQALLDTSEARFEAGDYHGALDMGRRAAAYAASSGNRLLEAQAWMMLAHGLIHTVRGRDSEALGLLARVLEVASSLERPELVADAEREAGYVSALEGRYGAAEAALRRSIAVASGIGDGLREGKALMYRGLCESDRRDLHAARSTLERAIDIGEIADDGGLHAYALASLARTVSFLGDVDAALELADRSVAAARKAGALSILPWGLIWRGDARFRLGDLDAARSSFSEAYALGCEIGDPCWEALAVWGIARLSGSGDRNRAAELLEDALTRSRRSPDTYTWTEAVVLTELVEVQSGADDETVAAARRLAVRGPMPDLVARIDAAAQTRAQTPVR